MLREPFRKGLEDQETCIRLKIPFGRPRPASAGALGKSLLDCIGNTPLLRLERIGPNYPNVRVLRQGRVAEPGRVGEGSARAGNDPGGGALRQALKPGQTILDATSGNTGIAYAMIAAALGYRVKLCLPTSASEERKKILAAFGAELVFTPGDEGSDGAILRAREIIAAEPGKYFYPDQYGNDSNWRAHYKTTAKEIWEQTSGRITHFVAGLGTSGTFVGTTRRLKELNPAIRCISLQPDAAFHGLEGWKHMPTAIVPAIYDATLADANLAVSTERAYRLVKQAAREEGLLLSPSAAAALDGCFQVAASLPPDERAVIVTVFPDSGTKYLSERFWDEV